MNARNNAIPPAAALHEPEVEAAMLAWIMIFTAILTVVIAALVTKR